MPQRSSFSRAEEEAGARESFEDAALYDFEYRRRRADVNFYRRLAFERRDLGDGPILDLACGTGRLMLPLLRDGNVVVGVDRSRAMLARAARRLSRLSPARRSRAMLLRADIRSFALRGRFRLAISAFHSLQHLVDDGDLLACFRAVRRALLPDGWFAFDLLPPDAAWIARDPERRWARTRFRHPTTGQQLVYTTNHRYDPVRRALHIRLYYQPVDAQGRRRGPERVHRLCQRQLDPDEVSRLLGRAGLKVIARFGAFDGSPLQENSDRSDEQHIYVARPIATSRSAGERLTVEETGRESP
jgi:SAM-dependent methyltransferase